MKNFKKLLLCMAMVGCALVGFGQTLNFTAATDTVTVGDTLFFTNTSTGFAPGQVFVWNYGEACYYSNAYGNPGWDIATNDSTCNDSIAGTLQGRHAFYYPGIKTVTLKAVGFINVVTKNIYVKQGAIIGGGICDVTNGNFEGYDASLCPFLGADWAGLGIGSPPGSAVDNWDKVWPGSPDFFTQQCGSTTISSNPFGLASPHSGDSYIGLIPYNGTPTGNITQYREYVTQQLPFILHPNCDYRVSMYARVANLDGNGNTGLNLQAQFGANYPNSFVPNTYLLTNNALTTSTLQPAVIDNFAWDQIQTVYNPGGIGGLQYLTIGNFNNNANTNLVTNNPPLVTNNEIYIFIDDVRIEYVEFNAAITNVGCTTNGSINLTPICGTAPYTYAWSNGATTQDVFNLPVGTYSVIVTDVTGLSCTESYSVTSAICQPTLSANIKNTCSGSCNGSIIVTAGGTCPAPFSYLWSNGGQSDEINMLCAGTYTVTVTAANGCTASAPYTVGTSTIPLIAFANYPLACQGAFVLSTPTAGTTYNWYFYDSQTALVYTATGTTVNLPNGINAATLTISGDNNGCLAVKTFQLGACCVGDVSKDYSAPPGNITMTQLAGLLATNKPSFIANNSALCAALGINAVYRLRSDVNTMGTGGKIYIYGNLIIDVNTDMSELEIVMAADREIIIQPNVTVVMGSDIQVKFGACGDFMWKGIRLAAASSRIFTIGNDNMSHFLLPYSYIISDAKVGIETFTTSPVRISNVLFNRCIIGIRFNATGSAVNNCLVSDCMFTSKNDGLTANQGLLKNPAVPNNAPAARGLRGIDIDRSRGTTIGYDEARLPFYTANTCSWRTGFNIFDNVDYGIWIEKTPNVSVFRNRFNNMLNSVRATGDVALTPGGITTNLTVGKATINTPSGSIVEGNYFDNYSSSGIELVYSVQLTAEYNEFRNTNLFSGTRYDIYYNNAYSLLQGKIANNTSIDFATGFYCNTTSPILTPLEISNNQFFGRLNPSGVDAGNPWSGTAIGIMGGINQFALNIKVNRFTNARTSIRVNQHDNAIIHDNSIYYQMPQNVGFSSATKYIRGIFVSSCSGVTIDENICQWQTSPNPMTNMVASLQGIRLNNVTGSVIKCNDGNGLGSSYYLYQTNTGNAFENNDAAISYYGWGMEAANVSPMGTSGTSNNNTFTNITSLRVGKIGTTFISPIQWYFAGASDNPSPFTAGLVNPLSASGTVAPCTPFTGGDDSTQMRMAVQTGADNVVNDEITYLALENEMRYSADEFAYKTLKNDATLVSAIPNADDYVDEKAQGNIGAYQEVKDAINENRLTDAATTLAAITDENLMEESKKAAMEILLRLTNESEVPLTATERTILESIAYSNSITGGSGVYIARGILGIDVDDDAIGAGNRLEKVQEMQQHEQPFVYPNPAKEWLYVYCKGKTFYEITDVTGAIQLKGNFDYDTDAIGALDIRALNNGIYLIKVTNADSTYKNKIVLQK